MNGRTFKWIGDQCDDVMVDEFKEELMEILLHKLYGFPTDWNQ